MIELVCYGAALVCFALAAANKTLGRVALFPLGAAFAVFPFVVEAIQAAS